MNIWAALGQNSSILLFYTSGVFLWAVFIVYFIQTNIFIFICSLFNCRCESLMFQASLYICAELCAVSPETLLFQKSPNSKASGETTRMHSLAWSLAVCIHAKALSIWWLYVLRHILSWSVLVQYSYTIKSIIMASMNKGISRVFFCWSALASRQTRSHT